MHNLTVVCDDIIASFYFIVFYFISSFYFICSRKWGIMTFVGQGKITKEELACGGIGMHFFIFVSRSVILN